MKILIKNCRVIDPAHTIDGIRDIFIDKKKIVRIAEHLSLSADRVIEGAGKIAIPGLVDMHVHLREPGREDKETIASGTAAALKGGVTSILVMPNTNPAIDSPQSIRLLKNIIKNTACSHVYISGAITKMRAGESLTDIPRMVREGVIAITDDGASVDNPVLFSKAMKVAGRMNIPVICHCEDKKMSGGGVMNLSFTSTRLGLRGISRESEYTRVERDIKLAEKSGCRIHIAHVSCSESVDIIAQAKKRKIRITAETAPHYFSLDEEFVSEYDANKKMNPPLREKHDVRAIRQGIKDGIIDVIASDHAPHTENEKSVEFDRAEFGVIGLETELSVAITYLVSPGIIGWAELVSLLTYNPSKILGIDKGSLGVGKEADIVILDPDKEWTVNKETFISKSKNSAFLGQKLKGSVNYTIRGGEIVYANGT
ncbi:MAG: dihydroorotase [Candidatus Omnitrophica bacterium]|nr:dihydroorotase [Candidatus Omnitrophota bacterium]